MNKKLLMFVLLMGAISAVHAEGKFDGPYIGLSYGTAKGNVAEGTGRWTFSLDPRLYSPTGRDSDFGSAAIGINAGYNFSLPHNNVIGIELDNHYVNDTAHGVSADYDNINNVTSDRLVSATSINNIQTLRLKLGHVFGDFHLYGTFGAAHANVDRKITQVNDGRNNIWLDYGTSDSNEKSVFGYALGAGADYAFNEHLTMNAKYLYTDFGDTTFHYSGTTFGGTASGKQKVGIDNSVLTVGVSYHF